MASDSEIIKIEDKWFFIVFWGLIGIRLLLHFIVRTYYAIVFEIISGVLLSIFFVFFFSVRIFKIVEYSIEMWIIIIAGILVSVLIG